MVLGKLSVLGRPTIWMVVGQGSIALAVGAGGGCLDIFTLLYIFSFFFWFKHILLLIKSNTSQWVGPQVLTTLSFSLFLGDGLI